MKMKLTFCLCMVFLSISLLSFSNWKWTQKTNSDLCSTLKINLDLGSSVGLMHYGFSMGSNLKLSFQLWNMETTWRHRFSFSELFSISKTTKMAQNFFRVVSVIYETPQNTKTTRNAFSATNYVRDGSHYISFSVQSSSFSSCIFESPSFLLCIIALCSLVVPLLQSSLLLTTPLLFPRWKR